MSSAHLTPPDLMTPGQANQAFETPPAPADQRRSPGYRSPVRGCARPEPINSPISGHLVIMGWSITNGNSGSQATFTIYNGLDTKGLLVATIDLVANESTREWFGPWGLAFDIGYFSTPTFGSVNGSIWIADWSLTGVDYPANSEWGTSR